MPHRPNVRRRVVPTETKPLCRCVIHVGGLPHGQVVVRSALTASRTCNANCDSAGVRIRQHGAASNDRTRRHHSGCSRFFGNCASHQNCQAAGCRAKKQAALAMDGSAAVKWRGQEPNKRRFTREIRGACPSATQNATQFRLIASSCSPVRWSSWRACGFPRRHGRLCRRGSLPTGHLGMVASPNDRKAMIVEFRFTTQLGHR
jgi:hypothetical protein